MRSIFQVVQSLSVKWYVILIFSLFILLSCSSGKDLFEYASYEVNYPDVTQCSVVDGSVLNLLLPVITLEFSVPIDPDSVRDNILLKESGFESVALDITWLSNKTLRLSPAGDLKNFTAYSLIVEKGITNDIGYGMRKSYVCRFNIIIDKKAPVVSGSEPADGMLNIPTSQPVILFFSKAMDRETTASAFSLLDSAGQSITGTISWTENSQSLFFLPDTHLEAFEAYRILLADTAGDEYGNTLEESFEARFRSSVTFSLRQTLPYAKPAAAVLYRNPDFFDNYILDVSTDRIHKYDSSKIHLLSWAVPEQCADMAVGSDGSVYVVQRSAHRILKYDPNGLLYGWLGKGDVSVGWHANGITGEEPLPGSGDGEFDTPLGIAVSDDGLIYVVDSGNLRIQVFSNEMGFIRSWKTAGAGGPGFPVDIVCDASGDVYVSDEKNYCISVFGPEGEFLRRWESAGITDNDGSDRISITFDHSENLYVGDPENHRILVYKNDGTLLTLFGYYDQVSASDMRPFGLSVTGDGEIMVGDITNQVVYVFTKWQ